MWNERDLMLIYLFQIVDLSNVQCPLWAKEACYMRFTILITLITIVISLYTIILIVFIIYRKQIKTIVKKKINNFHSPNPKPNPAHRVNLDFCLKDEEFVNREILPVMNNTACLKSLWPDENTDTYLGYTKSANYKRYIKDVKPRARIVVFSSNMLLQRYGHVDIKKIHSEMLKTKNTIYVFADIGPENSIYAFLEEQRDVRRTLKWEEENFWTKLFEMVKEFVLADEPKQMNEIFIAPPESFVTENVKSLSLSNLPEWPNTYGPSTMTRGLHTMTHSQV